MSEHQFAPVQRPQDCWDWLTREDVTRMAARAFELARAECFPPAGERFMQDGMPWSGRDSFAIDLALVFELQVKNEAHRLGIDRGDFVQDAARLLRWIGKREASAETPVSTTRLGVTS
jgi:hypothetical protein